ncbi:MAG: hypothetical protein J0L67_01770 [Cytophagales bacterium]|nr:hypothetical protein [Cytophagales bacterium]
MRRITILFLVLVSVTSTVLAQTGNYIHNLYALERIGSNQGGGQTSSIPTMPGPPPGVKGDVYLNKNFNKVVFQLFDGDKIIEGFIAKLDLKQNEFDVLTSQGVKVLKGNLVKSFVFVDSLTHIQSNFVSTKEWHTVSSPLFEGFYEILLEGKLTLLKRTDLIVKQPDFHPALNVGSKDLRFIKSEKFYYLHSGKVFEIPSKRNLTKIFTSYEKEMQDYIADKNLSSTKQRDLALIFDYYNRISTGN